MLSKTDSLVDSLFVICRKALKSHNRRDFAFQKVMNKRQLCFVKSAHWPEDVSFKYRLADFTRCKCMAGAMREPRLSNETTYNER
jgi:hypothetical protein